MSRPRRRRPSKVERELAAALFAPLERRAPARPTLWERQAHRLQSASHDARTCPLCQAGHTPGGAP